jgi:hypothetical protein
MKLFNIVLVVAILSGCDARTDQRIPITVPHTDIFDASKKIVFSYPQSEPITINFSNEKFPELLEIFSYSTIEKLGPDPHFPAAPQASIWVGGTEIEFHGSLYSGIFIKDGFIHKIENRNFSFFATGSYINNKGEIQSLKN